VNVDVHATHVTLLVIAKEPVAGRVKTRLCPPCSPEQSAELATAALADTLAAVARTPAARRVLVLDGNPGRWLPDGFEVQPQCGGGLDERLAHAFSSVEGPALLVGMDTPQVSPGLLGDASRELMRRPDGSVLGLSLDGGWWALGLRRADPQVFLGVPMSTVETGARQRDRLCARGAVPTLLPELRDVDTYADAHAVAADIPQSRFGTTFARVDAELDDSEHAA
jgi:glycosyltransferase A (GT-A) superfamily protein (DUF2064 family)